MMVDVDFRIHSKTAPVLDLYDGLNGAPVNSNLSDAGGALATSLKNTPITIAAPTLKVPGTLQADADTGILNEGGPWQWRTFYTKELPAFMWKTWGIKPSVRRLGIGASMGGAGLASTAFAAGYYKDILLLSGIYNFNRPLIFARPTIVTMGIRSGAFPIFLGESWQKNDPANPENLQRLKNMNVTMQAATGIINPLTGEIRITDPIGTYRRATVGFSLEVGSLVAAHAFLLSVKTHVPQYAHNVKLYQKALGTHSWMNWRSSMYEDGMLKDFLERARIPADNIILVSPWG